MGVWMLPPQRPSLDADLKPVGMAMRGKNASIVITDKDGHEHKIKPFDDDGAMATTNWEDESPAVADEDEEEVTPTIPGMAPPPVVTGHPKMIPNKLKIQPKCYVCGRGSPTSLQREDGTTITCCPRCIEDLGYEPIDATSFDLRLKPVT